MTIINDLTSIDEAQAEAAYARMLPVAVALEPAQLVPITLEVPAAIIVALRVARRLPTFEAALRGLSGYPIDTVMQLPDATLALFCAQSRYICSTNPPEQLPELLEQGSHWREILIADTRLQILRGTLRPSALDELTGSVGYKNVAFDLSALVRLYRENWANLVRKTGLNLSEIDAAGNLALRLALGVAFREPEPVEGSSVGEIRQRMFTVFSNTYDEVRRGLSFLRWHQRDANAIAPSLYAGRLTRKPQEEEKEEPEQEAGTVPPGSPNPPPLTLGAPLVTAESEAGTGAAKIPVGMPGSSPLMRA